MDKQTAINMIADTFNSSFNENRFRHFIRNLFNDFDEYKNASWITGYIKDSFKDHVKKYKRIGKYKDIDGNKLDVVVVHLRKESALDSARTMQRNFIASYLKTRGEKDAAVVAYFTDNTDDWRFSYVRMEYRQKITESGKIKVKEEFTSRRYSFLVGKNEPNHTAQQQLLPILQSDSSGPTLKEIEKAFDIEAVTKEFFLKYRELFLHTKEELDKVVRKDPKIKADFEAKGVDTVNFAKKLLGQIIFLYFLQKKGWFGVGRDDDWDTGSKHFLRELFEKKHGDYNNFFNDILEPLFYDALRNDRSHDDGYYSRFNCKIPFLNGGLFDPIGNYDWVHTDILLPNKLFSNQTRTKEGDKGTGILDVFDRYNFTVKEDEPLEKEVAIDPELLGKSYEKFNAIRPDNFAEFKKALKSGKKGEENKFNKKFGVYYTPREIVHYMCQQSLINYLHTEVIASEAKQSLTPSKEDIETLIHTGEQVSENEAIFLKKEQKIKKGEQKTTSIKSILPESIRNNAALIDEKLAEITVCDPAVGSGAFPVGMMSEIVKIRNVLTPFLSLRGAQATKQSQFDDNRTVYDFKRQCIEHSLYGVDIDPGAVEIAKLRLWLSLVVDEDDIKNIKPLPNLDYKVVCGNSLLGYPYKPRGLTKIERLKELFFKETRPKEKEKLHKEIDDAIYGLYKNTKQSLGYKVTMDFKINFSEVFRQKGGFDVVIANPPYGVSIKGDFRANVLRSLGKVPDYEIYYYFIELARKLLLKQKGIKCYIVPNTFLFNVFASNYRKSLLNEWEILLIIDCTEFKIFEAATVHNAITMFSKNKNNKKVGYKNTLNAKSFSELSKRRTEKIKKEILLSNNTNWALVFRLRRRVLELVSKIKSNNYRVIDIFPDISQGLIAYDKYQGQSEKIIKNRAFHFKEKIKDNLKPWLNGEDITPYLVKWNEEEYFDYCEGVANPREPKYFKGERILVREITNPKIYVGYTNIEQYHDPSVIVVLNNKRDEALNLLGILNSKLATFYHFNASPKATKGSFPKILVKDIKGFPLPKYEIKNRKLEDMVKKILSITTEEGYLQNHQKQAKVKALEEEIDQLVYKLYNLTPEEIKIVEESLRR